MEGLTHESDDSSSCTQSDSTNSSNGGNPFILRPRTGSHLELSRDSHSLNTVEDTRPFKLSCTVPAPHHDQHRTTMANLHGIHPSQYGRSNGAHTWICDSDVLPTSTLHSSSRFHPSSVHEECTTTIKQPGVHHGSIAYLGPTQSFYTPDQWTDVRQQGYMLKHVAGRDTPRSTLLLPVRCKMGDVKTGSFLLGLPDGRCRRTDGKKWRCGRAVVPNQKYCERHMHRGRGRSKAARLAKVNTSGNDDQSLNAARPLNKPLVHLLNQLAVPVQLSNPAPNSTQSVNQFPIPAQPLNWLPKLPFACLEPDNQAPMLAEPLNEAVNRTQFLDQPSNSTIPSGSLDCSIKGTPLRSSALISSGHALNMLQHDGTLAIRSGYKNTNGSVISNTSRRRIDDPEDVLTLDVEGIKRLLENAPCNNKRRRLSTGQPPKEYQNPAELLDVAESTHLSTQPKQPPSLVDVLRMVEPSTSINTQFNYQQIQLGAIKSGKDATARPPTSQVPLALLDRKQSKNCSSSIATLAHSPNMSATPVKEDAKLLTLFKVKCEEHEVAEDGDVMRHTEGPTSSASSSRTLDAPAYSIEVSQGRSGHSPALMEEMGHHIPGLVDESSSPHSNTARLDMNVCSSVEVRWGHPGSPIKLKGDSPALVAERLKLDVNVSALVEERWEHPGSVITSKRDSPASVAESLNHHEGSPKSKKMMVSSAYCEVPVIAKENFFGVSKTELGSPLEKVGGKPSQAD